MSEHWTPGHDGIPRTPPAVEAMTPAQLERIATPDGVALAGWWRRLFAYWIDGMLVAVAVQAAMLPLGLVGAVRWIGAMPPDALQEAWTRPLSAAWWFAIWSVVATLVASAAYSILMLRRLGWTVGKRLLGIRVRHRDHERRPTTREAAVRWAVQLAPAAVGAVPWIGGVSSLWTTIDGLRPLWHDRRQAFHDSAAQTSVVMA